MNMRLLDGLIFDNKDRWVFLVGCFATFYVNIVGRVYVGELIVFCLYFIKPEIRVGLPREIKILMRLMALWLLSAIISDICSGTPVIDMVKGSVSILFLLSLVPFVYWALYDRPARWMVFYLGTIVSSQLTYYLIFSHTSFGSTEIWRNYSYSPLFIGLAIFLYWKGLKKCSYLTFISFGVWILFGGSRHIFIVCTMTVIILIMVNKNADYDMITRLYEYKSKIFGLIIAMLIGAVVIDNVYEYLAANGTLGEYAYEKYMKQKYSSLGMASGRIEVIMDADLISKSPIIGYGSFAKDRTNYVKKFYREHKLPIAPGDFNHDVNSVENMLPRHSRIGGLWMWHGIGAGIFWIYTIFLIIRAFRTGSFMLDPAVMGLCVYSITMELWNTFFSIMAERLPLLFLWVYLIITYQIYKKTMDNQYVTDNHE